MFRFDTKRLRALTQQRDRWPRDQRQVVAFAKAYLALPNRENLSPEDVEWRSGRMPSTSAASEYLLKREFGPEQYDVVEAIARRLDVLTTDIGTYYEAADFFLDPRRMGEVYGQLGKEHTVSIVSADGYLEADENSSLGAVLFRQVLGLLNRGAAVRYFYPPPSIPGLARSASQFATLVGRYAEALGVSGLKPATDLRRAVQEQQNALPAGYMVSPRALFLFGWQTRYIIITRRDSEGRESVERALLYAQAERMGARGSSDEPDVWLQLPKPRADEFFRDLTKYAEPIDGLGPPQPNRLRGELQAVYQKGMIDDRAYKRLRELVDTKGSVLDTVESVVGAWWDEEVRSSRSTTEPQTKAARPLRYLDVGSGDGIVTKMMVERLGKLNLGEPGSTVTVQSTLLELGAEREYQAGIGSLYYSYLRQTLEQYNGRPESADLITFFHATYLLDPRQLLKAYKLLAPGGLLVIVAAPLETDVFNAITTWVDVEHVGDDPPPMTSGWGDERDPELLEKNPHRVFAEDVVRSLGLYFGDENVTCECLSKSISASMFLGTPEAEETAATMARMFSHRRRALNELNLEAAASLSSAIEAYRTNGHVQNDTWVISLRKRPVRARLQSEVFKLAPSGVST